MTYNKYSTFISLPLGALASWRFLIIFLFIISIAAGVTNNVDAAEIVSRYGQAALRGLRSVGQLSQKAGSKTISLVKTARQEVTDLIPGTDRETGPQSEILAPVVYQAEENPEPSSSNQTSPEPPKNVMEVVTAESSPAKNNRRAYRFFPGDELYVAILDKAESAQSVKITSDGCISYLYNIKVRAEGLTREELELSLEKELGNYYSQAKVSVTGLRLKGRSAFIYAPGVFAGSMYLKSRESVRSVLYRCGILEGLDHIDMDSALLVRDGKAQSYDFSSLLQPERGPGREIRAGDFIYLPSRHNAGKSVLYIDGKGNAGKLRQTDTLLQALVESGLTGGTDTHAYLIRGGFSADSNIYSVNPKNIISGKIQDVPLIEGDVILIGEKGCTRADLRAAALDALQRSAEKDVALRSSRERLQMFASIIEE